jgi:formylglycine-generating enzyme required for sulfatase activity
MELKKDLNNSRLFVLGAGSVGVLLVVIVSSLLRNEVAVRMPIHTSQLEQASAGVRQNADWHPIIRHLNGINMALVPAGCFTMGSTDLQLEEAFDSCNRFFGAAKCQYDFPQTEQPIHKVCFERPYWIGVTEITNKQYGSSSSTDLTTMYRGPAWPRETVNWAQAVDFCQARGARLPTEAEWEFAARGPDNLIYPWGDTFDPAFLISGTLSPGTAGLKREGVSWVGTYDMSGGVEEWVADWYGPYTSEPKTNPAGPRDGEYKVTRGGSWFSFASFFVRTTQRVPNDPDYASSVVGFRCAGDLE